MSDQKHPTPENEKENLTGHMYDGIEEYDNPIPGWWNWLFVATIIFSAGYFFIAIVPGQQLSANTEFDRAMAAEMKRQFAGGVLKSDAATLIRLSKDSGSLKIGESIWIAKCMACHNKDGSGLVGPNMTDDLYINVKKIEDIPEIVTNGRNNGAMPSWRNQLNANEIVVVSAYAASLRGKKLPTNPAYRGQPGVAIPPWE